jgi:Skp family chaperone for outer membrane proteins
VLRRALSAISEQENRTVKKTVMATGGFLILGVLCYVGQLSGQQSQPTPGQQPAPAPARTRIALLNLTYVIKNYDKYKHFQEEIKGIVGPFQQRDTDYRKQLDALRKQAEESARQQASVTQRDDLERQAKDIQRKLEDNSAEAKLELGKRSDNEMKLLFQDVYEAAQRYADSHDFELVLHYNDAVTPEDFMSAQNIARKLNTGALMPLYWKRNMDISVDLVNMLNYNMRSATTPAGGTPATPPAGGGGQ